MIDGFIGGYVLNFFTAAVASWNLCWLIDNLTLMTRLQEVTAPGTLFVFNQSVRLYLYGNFHSNKI